MKTLQFLGTARADLRAFPEAARRKAGAQLRLVQRGQMPNDWKPMQGVGPGVVEIRVAVSEGAFRVIYVASTGDKVLVLHCFQKKSAKTSRDDILLATTRYKAFRGGFRP